jgi:hypothetical protein
MPVAVQNMPYGQPSSAPAPYVRSTDTRSPADRLSTLNELKHKGLINEEEYRVKRMEIMNGL